MQEKKEKGSGENIEQGNTNYWNSLARSVSKSVSIWSVNATLANKIALCLENPRFRASAYMYTTYKMNGWYELPAHVRRSTIRVYGVEFYL